MRFRWLMILILGIVLPGCGSTKWTHTPRSATEQLLISDAMDRAVNKLDLRSLAGKQVFLDATPLAGTIDSAYLTSLIRQHILASGCILKEQKIEADYVVEVRTGAVGTDHRELLLGVPATRTRGLIPLPGVPDSIPEMPLATKNEQRAVVKLAAFAYNRKTGRPVWQSGAVPIESTVKDVYVFGAGPFRRGTIVEGTRFAGNKINLPLTKGKGGRDRKQLAVNDQAFFTEPKQVLAKKTSPPPQPPAVAQTQEKVAATEPPPAADEVSRAGHAEEIPPAAPLLLKIPEPRAYPPEPRLLEPPADPPAPQTRVDTVPSQVDTVPSQVDTVPSQVDTVPSQPASTTISDRSPPVTLSDRSPAPLFDLSPIE